MAISSSTVGYRKIEMASGHHPHMASSPPLKERKPSIKVVGFEINEEYWRDLHKERVLNTISPSFFSSSSSPALSSCSLSETEDEYNEWRMMTTGKIPKEDDTVQMQLRRVKGTKHDDMVEASDTSSSNMTTRPVTIPMRNKPPIMYYEHDKQKLHHLQRQYQIYKTMYLSSTKE